MGVTRSDPSVSNPVGKLAGAFWCLRSLLPEEVVYQQDSRTSGHERHTPFASINPVVSNRATARLWLNCRSGTRLVGHTGDADRRRQLFIPGQSLFIPGRLLFISDNRLFILGLLIGSARLALPARVTSRIGRLRRQSSSRISAISGQEATPSRVNCSSPGRTSCSSRIE